MNELIWMDWLNYPQVAVCDRRFRTGDLAMDGVCVTCTVP